MNNPDLLKQPPCPINPNKLAKLEISFCIFYFHKFIS